MNDTNIGFHFAYETKEEKEIYKLEGKIKKLKQQILDAENVIKELAISQFAQGDIAKKYWDKYKTKENL